MLVSDVWEHRGSPAEAWLEQIDRQNLSDTTSFVGHLALTLVCGESCDSLKQLGRCPAVCRVLVND
jgi:hypothetical protein